MSKFLGRIAEQLFADHGNRLLEHCLVFPNRRAGLYFLRYLSENISKPVWTPSIVTISELFDSFSKIRLADNEILLFELYKVYRGIKKSPESFDDFFFWGDMLLNDFDDIDKYLINAKDIFTNVYDFKKIDEEFGGLTGEQIEIIKRFWRNFEPDKTTREKSGFLSVWSILNELYNNFRRNLKLSNIGYEGMIFRDVVEGFESGNEISIRWKTIHFIGFNALNNCEKTIMRRLKSEGKARFYWDYDNSYINTGKLNSAGYFMRENLNIFGNDMPDDWSFDTLLSSDSYNIKRQVIEVSSDVAQVKLLPSLLNGISGLSPENAHHTAVILSDENLLISVLTSIPENIGDVNITMGYPLIQTRVYSLVKDLLDLQKNSVIRDGEVLFNTGNVISLLKNGLMPAIVNELNGEIINRISKSGLSWIPERHFYDTPQLKMVFTKHATPGSISDYFKSILTGIALGNEENITESGSSITDRNLINEFIYRIILSINRLELLAKSTDLTFTTDTWIRIFERLLRKQSVPFSGEPLSGIQIMGILETRVLDFENIIVLSVNEGVLPAVNAGSSFIPLSLREAFGLPSVNHQESIYAYHFYRLLHRARNAIFIYNSNSEGLRSGEMSRFLLQMKYDTAMQLDFQDLSFEIITPSSISEIIERTDYHSDQLYNRFLKGDTAMIISPSAINTWLNCRMKFYYRYVNDLTEPEKINADVDPAMLGNLIHVIIKKLYLPLVGKTITADIILSLLSDKQQLEILIDDVFCETFNRPRNSLISGNELIVREVLMIYILRILNADKSIAPFTILHLEDQFSFTMSVHFGEKEIPVTVGGKIDRIDKKDNLIRIVDYKTGNVAENVRSVESLFTEDRKKDTDGWLQTLLYCEAYHSEKRAANVYPSIYKIRKATGDKVIGKLKIKEDRKTEITVENYNMVRDDFINGLSTLIETIFNRHEPFIMTGDVWNKCAYCQFKSLCMR
jgi:hypothetical protein